MPSTNSQSADTLSVLRTRPLSLCNLLGRLSPGVFWVDQGRVTREGHLAGQLKVGYGTPLG